MRSVLRWVGGEREARGSPSGDGECGCCLDEVLEVGRGGRGGGLCVGVRMYDDCKGVVSLQSICRHVNIRLLLLFLPRDF